MQETHLTLPPLAGQSSVRNATWVTTDRGFARYQGLRLLNPLSP